MTAPITMRRCPHRTDGALVKAICERELGHTGAHYFESDPVLPTTIRGWQVEAYENAQAHGFHPEADGPSKGVPFQDFGSIQVGCWLMLQVTEIAEAMECVRKGEIATTIRPDGKPEGFGSELADVLIRLLDTAQACGIDLQHEVEIKALYNRTRPHKHGGKDV